MVVLAIDDDQDDLDIFSEALREIDPEIKCFVAIDSQKAIDALFHENEFLPDIIFMDVNMPKTNGKECLALIKSNDALKQIPVVMFSTTAVPHEIEFFKSLGATFLCKPSIYKNLVAALKGIFLKVSAESLLL